MSTIAVALGIGEGTAAWDARPATLVVLLLSPTLTYLAALYVVKRILLRDEGIRQRETFNWMCQEAQDEAEGAQVRATRALRRIESCVGDLSTHLTAVGDFLDLADREFSERAYGPYWEAIQAGIGECESFMEKLKKTLESHAEYESVLLDKEHTFPPLSLSDISVPDPCDYLVRLKAALRRGQTDFEFAMIWEQYKNRKAITDGLDRVNSQVEEMRSAFQGPSARWIGLM